jgi:hypothetical protein
MEADPEGYAVRGRVIDAKGAPVHGADVKLGTKYFQKRIEGEPPLDADLSGSSWSGTQTDEAGRFRFERAGTRGAIEIQARHLVLGVASQELSGDVVQQRDIDFGDIVLGPPLELRGVVMRHWFGESTATAEPFAGVEIELESSGMPGVADVGLHGRIAFRTPVVASAADGSFVFEDLMPGKYRVIARVDGYGEVLAPGGEADPQQSPRAPAYSRTTRAPPECVTNTVLGSRHDEPVTILVPRRTVLRGVVVLPDGRPASAAEVGVRVGAVDERRTTNEVGRFEFPWLGRAPVTLTVWPPKSAQGVLASTVLDDVVPGAHDVRVVLAVSAVLEGVVVGADGQPVAFVGVTALSAMREELDFAYTDEQGRFKLRVPPGEAIGLEACPTKLENENLRKLDRASPLRGRADGVRAGVSDLVLRLVRKH